MRKLFSGTYTNKIRMGDVTANVHFCLLEMDENGPSETKGKDSIWVADEVS